MAGAELLRRAAAALRKHAEEASIGPWTVQFYDIAETDRVEYVAIGPEDTEGCRVIPFRTETEDAGYHSQAEADISYAVLVHPPVALALADLLDAHAKQFDEDTIVDSPECPSCDTGYCGPHPEATWCERCGNAVESPHYPDKCECWTKAFAVARAVLREEP